MLIDQPPPERLQQQLELVAPGALATAGGLEVQEFSEAEVSALLDQLLLDASMTPAGCELLQLHGAGPTPPGHSGSTAVTAAGPTAAVQGLGTSAGAQGAHPAPAASPSAGPAGGSRTSYASKMRGVLASGYAAAPVPVAPAPLGRSPAPLSQFIAGVANNSSTQEMIPAASNALQVLLAVAAHGCDTTQHAAQLLTALTEGCMQQDCNPGKGVAAQMPHMPASSLTEVTAAFRGVEQALANLVAVAFLPHLRTPALVQPAAAPSTPAHVNEPAAAGALAEPAWFDESVIRAVLQSP